MAEDFTTSLVEHRKARLAAKFEAQGLHLSEESALLMAHRCERLSEDFAAPGEVRPARSLVDVTHFSPHTLR